jgi:hypothetical protein
MTISIRKDDSGKKARTSGRPAGKWELDDIGKATDQTVMPDPTEIFETWTGKEVGWINCERGRGDAAAGRWKRVRRRKKKTKTGGMNELTRGEGKIRRGRETVEPMTRGLM